MQKWLTFIWIVLLTVFVTRFYFLHPGVPITHDGENHLARFANYKIAVKEGQLPPRFAPNLVNHYGYPVFNYNYPLANMLSLPFSVAKFNYEVTFKILMVFSVMGGLVGIKKWLEVLEFTDRGQQLAVAVFALSPYVINTIVFRGNIGEVMAMCLLPWLLWLVELIRTTQTFKPAGWSVARYVLLLTAFLLSHNVTVLFGVPLVWLYAAWRYGGHKNSWREWGRLWVLGIGLSLWFWLPAIAEKSEIVIDAAGASLAYVDHFPTWWQLWWSPLVFGYSYVGSIDSLSFAVGWLQWGVLVLALLSILKKRKASPILGSLFLLTSLFLLLFQLSWTAPVWEIIPLLRFIQFPWRLGLFIPIVLAPLAALIVKQNSVRLNVLLSALLIMQLGSTWLLKPIGYLHQDKLTYDQFTQSTSTANENLPKTFTHQTTGEWSPTPEIIQGTGEVIVKKWNGSYHHYQLHITEPATIIEPTMYFLGWQTNYSRGLDVWGLLAEYDANPAWGGRIAYQLPPGEYEVITQFTQRTPARLLGNALTVISGILLLSVIFPTQLATLITKISRAPQKKSTNE